MTATLTPHLRAARIRHRWFSPARIWAMATNTFTELVRLKIFYFLLIFAMLLIASSILLVDFTFQGQFQMLKDVSLGAMSIFTTLLAILATANLLPKDIEDRTLYTILAKPVPRFEYLTGKLLGVLLLLLVSLLCMGGVFAGVLWWRVHVVTGEIMARGGPADAMAQAINEMRAGAFDPELWEGGIIIYVKACLLASMTLLVSTFASSSIFTIIMSFALYLIGELEGTARDYWQAGGSLASESLMTRFFLGPIVLIFPDLQAFDLVDEIVAGHHLPLGLFLKTIGLGVTYLLVYLFAGYFVFSTKEL